MIKKIPTKPTGAAAPAGKTITLNQVFQQAGKLASEGNLAQAVKLLEQASRKFPPPKGQGAWMVPDLMVHAATRLRVRDPATAAVLAGAALERDAQLVSGWVMLSGLRDRVGDLQGAKDACLQVVHAESATPQQVLTAANLLVRYKEDKVAIEAAAKAFEALGRPLEWASALLYIAQKVADWPLCRQLADQLRAAHQAGQTVAARESPRTNLLWCDDEAINIAVLKEWSLQTMPGDVAERPLPAPLDGRRIRVGYLSSDFRDHPTSRLVNGLFRHHDRSKFELFLYCSGWDDGSAMRKEVESHFDHIHTVTALSDEAASKLIRSHGVDVLVELNGPTRANRMGILRHRPAPVQIDYLGWPGSVGGRVVDYVVGDSYSTPPGAEKLYPEKVIRLHQTYQVNDYAARQIPEAPSRARMSLPEGKRVIGMFNAINKVSGEVWSVWMQIMKAVPDSVLWILDPGPVARKNIARACAAEGVDPRRIIAAPAMKQDDHLARLQCCDLMVDPWPYGGHTSTSDALFAGVPVVAVAGTNFASRVSGGLLKAARLEALVQPTLEGYVETAVSLLKNPRQLARVKNFIRENIMKSDVFDAKTKARQLEAAYGEAVRRSLDGKPPRHTTFGAKPGAAAKPAPATPLAVEARDKAVVQPIRPVATAPDTGRLPLVLVCGPWSSGTSAVAGLLAKAGLAAPGPYVAVNDPKTPATYEMKALQTLLRKLASEDTLERLVPSAQIVKALREFRDTSLKEALRKEGVPAHRPVMLKHALTALMLPELCEVFDVRIVGVIRPFDAIESTRLRRNWPKSFGSFGASVVYRRLFEHLINRDTPFVVVRYSDMLANSKDVLADLLRFCQVEASAQSRAAALAFVSRPAAKAVATQA